MSLPTRHVMIGLVLGAVSAMAVASIGPGMVVSSFADELSGVVAPGFDTDNLVKHEGREYTVTNADWVSTEASATSQIKKVEGGRVSYITVTTTPTGAYSTDALFSRHVQYPGVTVEQVSPKPRNRFSFWDGNSWFSFGTRGGNSFFYFSTDDTSVSQRNDIICVSGSNYRVC